MALTDSTRYNNALKDRIHTYIHGEKAMLGRGQHTSNTQCSSGNKCLNGIGIQACQYRPSVWNFRSYLSDYIMSPIRIEVLP